MLFSLPEIVSGKKIRVDFDAPDLSSNGGLVLLNGMRTSIAWKIGKLIPDVRKQEFMAHWPNTVFELRGDSHFASHEFMDWANDKWGSPVKTCGLSKDPC